MERRVTDLVVLGILCLLLTRHLWLASYIHPYADDLSYAFTGMQSELCERLGLEYRTWNGRYFSNVLVLRGPMVLGLEQGLALYRMVPVSLMALFIMVTYAFLRVLLGDGLSRLHGLICSVSFLLLYIHLMPHAGEGFYWYTGAVTYMLPCILLLLYGTIQVHAQGSNGWGRRVVLLGLSTVLVAAIVGSNEVSMVHLLVLQSACLFQFKILRHQPDQWMLLGWAILCAMVVFLAPGNVVRGAHFGHTHEPLRTVAYSILLTLRFVAWWLLSPMFLFASLLILKWVRESDVRTPFRMVLLSIDRNMVLILSLLPVLIAMVLPYWSTGMLGQHRTVNVALFVFLPLIWFTMLVWDAQVFQPRSWAIVPRWLPRKPVLLVLMILGALLLRQDGAVTRDLLQGHARRYDAQCMDRYIQVRSAIEVGSPSLALEALDAPPRSLNVLDLQSDPGHWMNTSLARFLGGDSLAIYCLAVD